MSEHSTNGIDALLAHPTMTRLQAALAAHQSVEVNESGIRRAAVALMFRAGEEGRPELLFIKRAEYPGDPWSGQVAFPGGREEGGDASLVETAVRESREETGIDLEGQGRIIGTLDDLYPRSVRLPPISVRPFVFAIERSEPLILSSEVALAFWIPFGSLATSDAWREDTVFASGIQLNARVFRHHDHVIWGMTERILAQLLRLVEFAT
jgi:8-oxo-dGTP pyrophosphatase MutT (NUDIX family)